MKLTKERLIEMVKEEYQKILNEGRVRLSSMDINFRGDQAQMLGNSKPYGKLVISRQDAKAIMYAIAKEFSIRA